MIYYAEIAIQDVRKRNKIVPTQALSSFLDKGAVYRSYYYYDEDIVSYVEKTHSVSGFKGNYYLPYLIYDIDVKEKTNEETLVKVYELLDKLENKWEVNYENIVIYFSGRGYHIVTPDIFGFVPSNSLPMAVRATIGKYFPEVDGAPLVNTGLIRMPNSINAKTGLYKIGFKYEDFVRLGVKDIIDMASSPKEIPNVNLTPLPMFSDKIIYELEKESTNIVNTQSELTSIVTCMQKLYKEEPKPGDRHEKLLRMGSAFRRAGIPREGVMHLLKKWAYNMDETEIVKLVNTIFDKGYLRYRCSDKIMTAYCDERCIFFANKNYTPDVLSADSMEQKYIKYLKTNPKENAVNLKNLFGLEKDFFVFPGELLVIYGDTGIGKSTFAYNLGIKSGKQVLINSTEMDYKEVYPRLIQMAHGLSESQVAALYDDGVSLSQKIGHMSFTETVYTIDNLKKSIIEYKPEIVIIDTLEDLYVDNYFKDPLDAIAKQLKQMAIEMRVIIIAIHHISKHAAEDETGKRKSLTVHSGKGASAVEQKADKVIGIEGDRDGTRRVVRTLKSRNQSPFSATFLYDWTTWRFNKE